MKNFGLFRVISMVLPRGLQKSICATNWYITVQFLSRSDKYISEKLRYINRNVTMRNYYVSSKFRVAGRAHGYFTGQNLLKFTDHILNLSLSLMYVLIWIHHNFQQIENIKYIKCHYLRV